jgi:hypothetical protein
VHGHMNRPSMQLPTLHRASYNYFKCLTTFHRIGDRPIGHHYKQDDPQSIYSHSSLTRRHVNRRYQRWKN